MQIGRDDYKVARGIALDHPAQALRLIRCPFPKDSEDAKEWVEGQRREAQGNERRN